MELAYNGPPLWQNFEMLVSSKKIRFNTQLLFTYAICYTIQIRLHPNEPDRLFPESAFLIPSTILPFSQ